MISYSVLNWLSPNRFVLPWWSLNVFPPQALTSMIRTSIDHLWELFNISPSLGRASLMPLVASSDLKIKYVPAQLQLADIFTKSLGRPTFLFLHSKLLVHNSDTLGLRGKAETQKQQTAVTDLRHSALHSATEVAEHVIGTWLRAPATSPPRGVIDAASSILERNYGDGICLSSVLGHVDWRVKKGLASTIWAFGFFDALQVCNSLITTGGSKGFGGASTRGRAPSPGAGSAPAY
ncbi:Hypothetical predicted protein [Olea europaea subsp. europaea]|uniref:Uncharacterized protein n=1 Tax=Olea europaea subsp. europaea TaxID=158383 RepID=A0A8S0SGW8_OLEEU|nr:Hypothetical predicted protein [Olea europaea subsp. europaea]